MCLGIPGRIVELRDNPHLATVDILGEKTAINIGMIEEPLVPGDYVLIHVGFAMTKIDADEARKALDGLRLLGNDDKEAELWV
ncbi:MAG TPA: HypC/HybG/HupF family hydrogenase formation chaperone [Acidimicrobiales bacterium]|jgi:hydrogenase expression/formation protein HypC|nr:HypC/HybG/HupF family hydrogenase formation chaperone [Acidimicrobiales bacterium]